MEMPLLAWHPDFQILSTPSPSPLLTVGTSFTGPKVGETLEPTAQAHRCGAALAANQIKFVLHQAQGRRTQPELLQCGRHEPSTDTPSLH